MPKIQTILVAGDSHTWGQGSGGELELDSPVNGELRPLAFTCPSYVNLLRQRIGELTGSFAIEYQGKALSDLCEGSRRSQSALLDEGHRLVLPANAELYRICFQGQTESSRAEIYLDGIGRLEIDLTMPVSAHMYRFIPLLCEDGPKSLEIRCRSGSVLIYRIEAYRGPYALINAGIGSCPLNRYLTPEVWDSWITPWQPAVVIAEGNTINDWLTRESPAEYGSLLTRELEMIRSLGARPYLHTVSPILGEQAEPHSPYLYPEMVDTVRKVAAVEGVPLADTNRSMEQFLSGLPEQERPSALFCDPWHPNPRGHMLYAQALFELLTADFLFSSPAAFCENQRDP